jgi:hypothetical protein
MYLIYNIDQIHKLFNKHRKWTFANNYRKSESARSLRRKRKPRYCCVVLHRPRPKPTKNRSGESVTVTDYEALTRTPRHDTDTLTPIM